MINRTEFILLLSDTREFQHRHGAGPPAQSMEKISLVIDAKYPSILHGRLWHSELDPENETVG
jgi:hypothetical protein